MPRRLASFFFPHSDVMTLGVKGIVVNDASEVLLIRHSYYPGWHLPGGGVERNERIDQTLCRELKEEAGVIVEKPAKLFGIYTNFEAFPGDHVLLFIVDRWRQDRIPKPNLEILGQRFCTLANLPEGTTAATRRRLDEVFNGQERATAW